MNKFNDLEEKLLKLKKLYDDGAISLDAYEKLRKEYEEMFREEFGENIEESVEDIKRYGRRRLRKIYIIFITLLIIGLTSSYMAGIASRTPQTTVYVTITKTVSVTTTAVSTVWVTGTIIKPAVQANLSISVSPNPVGITPGQSEVVIYTFTETNGVGVNIIWREWVWVYLDGRQGHYGAAGNNIRVEPSSSIFWEDRTYLPIEVAEHARVKGWNSVILRMTFLGIDDNGNNIKVTSDLTVSFI